ncbi:hypothetical protein EZS27_003570 [termite gut metagenome]|uniref:Helicase ATP-binding domain-containing protein n=1 Tax=termite gut metagenome TaxID=433724 RepID=A0A5J4SUU2_9ZZZZ
MLLQNQLSAIKKLEKYKVGALFMSPGTGKTRACLELVNSVKGIDSVFYFAPLRTIANCCDEVEKWGSFHVPVQYTGVESISASDRIFLNVRSQIEKATNPFIVIDESIKIKNIGAKRTKRLLELSKLTPYKLILNGTPLSKNLLDLKPQMDFLSSKILSMTNGEFKDTFCEYTTITKRTGNHTQYTKEYITGYSNIDYLYKLIGRYVFECDLKLQIAQCYNTLFYDLSEEEEEEYQKIKKSFLSDESLECKNNNIFLEMTQKMQHAYCCSPEKFDLLDTLFKEIDEARTIIFCKYIRSRETCEQYFKKATVLSYQKEALGLNLQHLCYTVYFDKIWDYALRLQSGRRTFRTGQEYDCRYWDLTGSAKLEGLIDRNIDKKRSMLEYLKSKSKKELIEEL